MLRADLSDAPAETGWLCWLDNLSTCPANKRLVPDFGRMKTVPSSPTTSRPALRIDLRVPRRLPVVGKLLIASNCKTQNREGRAWLNYSHLQPLSTLKLARELNTHLVSGHHPRNPRLDDANLEILGNTAGRSAGAKPYQAASVAAY